MSLPAVLALSIGAAFLFRRPRGMRKPARMYTSDHNPRATHLAFRIRPIPAHNAAPVQLPKNLLTATFDNERLISPRKSRGIFSWPYAGEAERRYLLLWKTKKAWQNLRKQPLCREYSIF